MKFGKITFLFLIFLLAGATLNAQFIQNSSRSLFSDVKAFKPGDAIMVLIMEDTRADNSADTENQRSTSLGGGFDFQGGDTDLNYDAGLETGTSHDARGSTTRQERIRSRLSARVVELDENGNLIIEGTRTTKINGETQTIVIKGYVRPVDVTPQNSVYSYNILDLTLIIEGEGSVSNIQEPGLITKFIRLLF